MADKSVTIDEQGSPFAFFTWPLEKQVNALHSVRRELGLTRNGRLRSVLRSHDMWRLMTACVVAGREVVDAS